MKKLLITLVLFSSIQKSNALELEFIHLKSGLIVDVKKDSYDVSIDEIESLEISTDSKDTKLISPIKYRKFLNSEYEETSAHSKMGGEGGSTN